MITTKTGNYFECKVRREGTLEDGTQAKLNELYAVSAESFTDCEAKMVKFISSYSNDVEVLTEVRAKYKEVFLTDNPDDMFYKVQVSFITIDDASGKEKRTKVCFLVQGSSVETAKKNVDEVMASSAADYKIISVGECAIVDIVE